jgi:hypothetical protein
MADIPQWLLAQTGALNARQRAKKIGQTTLDPLKAVVRRGVLSPIGTIINVVWLAGVPQPCLSAKQSNSLCRHATSGETSPSPRRAAPAGE